MVAVSCLLESCAEMLGNEALGGLWQVPWLSLS